VISLASRFDSLYDVRSAERKKRQVYRGEMHGQLPFEIRGMDDPVPTVDFSPTGSLDSHYSLERADVDSMR
jgi:autophagy-related protein 11